MKERIPLLFIIFFLTGCASNFGDALMGGTSILQTNQGGTGSSSTPILAQTLSASSSGKYEPNSILTVNSGTGVVNINSTSSVLLANINSSYARFGANGSPLIVGAIPTLSDPLQRIAMIATKDTNTGYGMGILNTSTGTIATAVMVVGNSLTTLDSSGTPTNALVMGRTGSGWADPAFASHDQNASYIYSTDGNIEFGSAGTTSSTGNTYIISGGVDSKDKIRAVFTWDGRLGIGTGMGTTPPDSLFAARGTNGSMRMKDAGNMVFGDDRTITNVPTLAVNQPIGGYGANAKNIALFTGYQSSTSTIFDNANLGMIQLTNTPGNALTYNFYNAVEVDSAAFGTKLVSHADKANNTADFFIATAFNDLPTMKYYVTGDGYTTIGRVQNSRTAVIRTSTVGLSVIDPNNNGMITISGQGNTVSTTAGIEFNWERGVGGGTKNISRILGFTQAGGGGHILFQTAASATGAYSTKTILSSAGNFGVGYTEDNLPPYKFSVTGTHYFSPTWKDANIGMQALGGGASSPAYINLATSTIKVLGYSGTNATPDEVSGCEEIQHDWVEGSLIIPHLHWYPGVADTGDVKWQLEYYIVEQNVSPSVASTIVSTTVSVATTDVWKHTLTEFSTISMTGYSIGAQFCFRLFRDATDTADTYEQRAAVATFGVHYQVNSLGSFQKTSKY